LKYLIEIPFGYNPHSYIHTEEAVGYGIESFIGGDIPYPIGNTLLINSPVKIYKFIDCLNEHIVISRDEPRFINPKGDDNYVCLYSKYYYPNKNPIICRYLKNYAKVIHWITDEVEGEVNSVWYDFLEHPRNILDTSPKYDEEWFTTFSDVDVISLLTSRYIHERIVDHYKLSNYMVSPQVFTNQNTFKKYLDKNINGSKLLRSKGFVFREKRLLSSIHIDDVYIVNKLNTLPIRSLTCIYYTDTNKLEIKNAELITAIDVDSFTSTIKEICKMFDHSKKVTLNYSNEELYISTERTEMYINVPIMDLSNHLLKMQY